MEESGKQVRIAPIQSVERAIWILKCFEQKKELSLAEITQMVGLHKSTAFGLVSSLEAYQLLQQDQNTLKYRLGIEMFRLGNSVDIELRKIVQPYLTKIVDLSLETANFVIPNDSDVLYVEKKESPHSMRISTSTGVVKPMYCTACGKAILAELPAEEAEELLRKMQFEKQTENTLMTPEKVMKQLTEIQNLGYAVDDEEMEYGLVCLAAAIVNSGGRPVGAISVSGPTVRMTEEKRRAFGSQLVRFAAEIGAML